MEPTRLSWVPVRHFRAPPEYLRGADERVHGADTVPLTKSDDCLISKG